jgi:hypothetical protein
MQEKRKRLGMAKTKIFNFKGAGVTLKYAFRPKMSPLLIF